MLVWWTTINDPADIPEVVRGAECYRDRTYHLHTAYWRNDRMALRLHFHGGVAHVWEREDVTAVVDGAPTSTVRWALKFDSAKDGDTSALDQLLAMLTSGQRPAGDNGAKDNGAPAPGKKDIPGKDVH